MITENESVFTKIVKRISESAANENAQRTGQEKADEIKRSARNSPLVTSFDDLPDTLSQK